MPARKYYKKEANTIHQARWIATHKSQWQEYHNEYERKRMAYIRQCELFRNILIDFI